MLQLPCGKCLRAITVSDIEREVDGERNCPHCRTRVRLEHTDESASDPAEAYQFVVVDRILDM